MHGGRKRSCTLGVLLTGLVSLSLLLLFKTPPATTTTEKNDPEYQQIVSLINRQDYDAAIRRCQRLLTRRPDYHPAYRKLIEASRDGRRLSGAVDYLHNLLKQGPVNACAYYGLGLARRENKEHEQALPLLQAAVNLRPPFADVFSLLAATYRDLRKLDEAVVYLSALVRSDDTYAYAHYGLGCCYQFQNAADKALAQFDCALALDAQLVEALIRKAEIKYYRGLRREALVLYQQALGLAKKKNDTENQGRAALGLGGAYMSLGEYPKALNYFYQAQKIFRELGNRSMEAPVLYNIALIYHYRSEYGRALEYLQSARAVCRAVDYQQGEANCLKLSATIYRHQHGDYQRALDYYQQALKIYQSLTDRLREAEALNSLGNIYHENMGDPMAALDYYQRALSIFQELGNQSSAGETLLNLSTIYRDFGNHRRALEYLQRAWELHKSSGDRRSEADALGNLANIYQDMGDYAKALDYRRQALTIFRKLNNRRGEGRVLNDIGDTYEILRDYPRALEYYQQALALNRQINYRQGEGVALNNVGSIYAHMGEPAKAIACQQSALKLGEALNHPPIHWVACAGLARAHAEQGSLEQAVEFYKKAVLIIERVRGQLPTGDQKAGFMQNKLGVYEGVVGALMKWHAVRPGRRYDEEAFAFVERSRARALLEHLEEGRVRVHKGITGSQRRRERELEGQIAQLQKTLIQDPPLSAEQRATHLAELHKLEQRWEDFLIELRRANPHYAQLQYPEPYTLRAVQQLVLQPGEGLLEYMLGEERSFLFLVTQERFEVAVLPNRSRIETAVKKYQSLIRENPEKYGRRIGESFAAVSEQGYQLYKMLLNGLPDPLPARLIIVPDGLLHYLPFEALVREIGDQGSGFGRAGDRASRYLVEDYTILYAPSASVLGEVRREGATRNTAPPGRLLALGDPAVPDADLWGQKVSRLPSSRAEVEQIAQLYPADRRKICLGAEAKESLVKKEASRYQHIHIAAHGLIDDQAPLRSALLLAADELDDGLMQTREIFNLELNADLVVLSACETGLGKAVRGEGLMGMTRALLYAGAQSAVVSLWSAHDEATRTLMGDFYDRLLHAKNKGEALRQAKCLLTRSERKTWRHPYFWAGFVLVGNDR